MLGRSLESCGSERDTVHCCWSGEVKSQGPPVPWSPQSWLEGYLPPSALSGKEKIDGYCDSWAEMMPLRQHSSGENLVVTFLKKGLGREDFRVSALGNRVLIACLMKFESRSDATGLGIEATMELNIGIL